MIFLVLTIFLIIATRPFAVKKLKLGKEDTNINSLIGQNAVVIDSISEFSKGSVKTKNGVVWVAASENSKNREFPRAIRDARPLSSFRLPLRRRTILPWETIPEIIVIEHPRRRMATDDALEI